MALCTYLCVLANIKGLSLDFPRTGNLRNMGSVSGARVPEVGRLSCPACRLPDGFKGTQVAKLRL